MHVLPDRTMGHCVCMLIALCLSTLVPRIPACCRQRVMICSIYMQLHHFHLHHIAVIIDRLNFQSQVLRYTLLSSCTMGLFMSANGDSCNITCRWLYYVQLCKDIKEKRMILRSDSDEMIQNSIVLTSLMLRGNFLTVQLNNIFMLCHQHFGMVI